MDRGSRATVVLRAGTLLVAIALAFGLISYMSSLTVSGYHADQCFQYYCGNFDEVPPGTYTVLSSWSPASPQQMYFFNMSSTPVGAKVYLLNTNQTAFNVWIADRTGLSLANVSSYGPENLAWFSDYVAAHGEEVRGQYDVSGTLVIVKYFVSDVEPLMAVVTNGNTQSPLNLTYSVTSIGVTINPSLGLRATGYTGAPGAILVAVGMALKRRGDNSDHGGDAQAQGMGHARLLQGSCP